MSTTTRVDEYATRFEAVNDEVIAAVEACTDEQWRQHTASEDWSIGVVAHHIGEVNQAFAGMVGKFAAGETFNPTTSMDEVHRQNAQHARDYANVTREEALAVVRAGATAVAEQLRSLSDEQLDRPAGVFGGNELTVVQVIEYVVIGHTAEHQASIEATLNG